MKSQRRAWNFGERPRDLDYGFTLLEVVIAVAIIAMIGITIFRFVDSNLRAIQFSTQLSNEAAELRALTSVLRAQLNDLPLAEPGVILGDAHMFGEKSSDELHWICTAGNGLFTEFAEGRYKVTLALQPILNSTASEIGLRRSLADGSESDTHWIRLAGNIEALEIRYFDPRLNAWLEKWTDQTAKPALVRVRIWRNGADTPYEAVIQLPMAKLPT